MHSAGPRREGVGFGARGPLLVHGWLLAGAAAAVFLAGGPEQGSLGVFLVCAGLALALRPPQVQVDWRLWLAAGGLVASGALALLPSNWFRTPAWRQTLAASPAISLPASVSLVPWETAFWLAVLAISLLTGLFLLAQPIRSRGLLSLATLAALCCAVYAGAAIYARRTGWHYPFDGGATFGFFPNRNHTATFLVMGSILAMGVLAMALRDGRWLISLLTAASLTVCVIGLIFFSASRGGIIFLVAGTLIWVAGLGQRHRPASLLVSMGALAIAVSVLLLASGSPVRNRLLGKPEQETSASKPKDRAPRSNTQGAAGDTPYDFRTLIYRDTLDMIRDFPITGAGLGAFAVDFQQYRKASLSDAAPIHPESDWLMLTAEAGIPALVCALTLGWLLFGRLRSLSEHPFWPVRWGCVVAASAAILHGLVDVPAHRVALGWWILAVAGLGFQLGGAKESRRSRVQHGLFMLGGVGALVLGFQLIRAEWFGGRPLPPFLAAKSQAQFLAVMDRHDIDDATKMAREAVKVSPMEAPLYYWFGRLLLNFDDKDAEVDQVFKAQRLLNRTWPEVPLDQGTLWITIDTQRAAALWLDALGRRQRIDQVQGRGQEPSIHFYRDLLDRAQQFPAVQRILESVASQGPAYALAWVEAVNPDIVREQLGQLTADANFPRRFSETQRRQFLRSWYAKGDRDALSRFVDNHPDWQAAAWPIHLQQIADAQHFEQAVDEAAEHYHVSLALPEPGSDGVVSGNAPESGDTITMFEEYWRTGNTVAARRVLNDGPNTSQQTPIAADYWRLKAALAARDLAWAEAWQYLKRYVQQTNPADIFP